MNSYYKIIRSSGFPCGINNCSLGSKQNNQISSIKKELSLSDIDAKKLFKYSRSSSSKIISCTYNGEIYSNEKDFIKQLPLDFPVKAHIELTNLCNLSCKHCYHPKILEDTNSVMDVISVLIDSGTLIFELIGGEPFLYKNLYEVLKLINVENRLIYLISNGQLINSEVAKALSRYENLKIIISIDGDKSFMKFLRGPNTYERAIKSIKLLVANNIPVSLNMILSTQNIKYLEHVINLGRELSVKSIKLIPLKPYTHSDEMTRMVLSRKKLDRVFKNAQHFGRNIGINVTGEIGQIIMNPSFYGCSSGITDISVDPLGNVMLCPVKRDINFGNILDTPISDIWLSLWNYINTKSEPECMNCVYSDLCFEKCRDCFPLYKN